MPSLLEAYKEYLVMLKKVESSYIKLERNQKGVGEYLHKAKDLFKEYGEEFVNSVAMEKKLAKLKIKKEDLELELGKVTPGSEEAQVILDQITNKIVEIKNQQNIIQIQGVAFSSLENNISWAKDKGRFSTPHLKNQGVSQTSFNTYIASLNEAVRMRAELVDCQVNVERLFRSTPKTEKDSALEWSEKHIKTLPTDLRKMGDGLIDDFHYTLNKSIARSADIHLKYLNRSKYAEGYKNGKYQLSDLETFAEARRAKQERYHAMLPSYVAAEIAADFQLKGKRWLGIGSTNTEGKLRDIQLFFENPLTGDKIKDTSKIKELLSAVGVYLSPEAQNRVYDAAVTEQEKLAEANMRGDYNGP